MKKDILQVIQDLLKHRTEDAGCYEFVLEAWIEEAAAEIERLRERERYNAEAVVPERSKGDMAGCSPVESDASYPPCPHRGDTGVAAGSNPADSTHDAVPEAIASPSESSVPLGNGGGCGGIDKPVTLPAMGTGNTTLDGALAAEAGAGKPQISHPQAGNTQTAPPCVETDGPPSKGEGLHIPDSRTRLSESEIDALEYVVEQGRIACMDDYGILRSLLVRVRPEWENT